MLALVVPVLAQTIALSMGDRTETRLVHNRTRLDLEAETRPYTRLSLTWPRAHLGAGYTPTFLVAPLENSTARERLYRTTPDRQIEFLHAVDAQGDVNFGSPRTTYSLTQNVTWAQRNFQREALSNQPISPGGATPQQPTTPPPGTLTSRAVAEAVSYGSERTSFSATHLLSPNNSSALGLGYAVSGGLGVKARRQYPLIQGPDGSVSLRSTLSPRDEVSSVAAGRYYRSELGQNAGRSVAPTRSYSVTVTESINHQFTPNFRGTLGGGAGYIRNMQTGQPTDDGLSPTGGVSLLYTTQLGRGTFGSQLATNLDPVLDAATGTLDWRVASSLLVRWTGSRLTLSLGSQAAASLVSANPYSSQSFTAQAAMSYDLRHGFAFDAGARGAYQRYGGRPDILPSEAILIALSYGTSFPLN